MNRKLFFAAALIYILSAYFNSGYFHPDEHYQIIEFSEYLAGNTKSSDLPWEFPARLRPAIQPTLCFGILNLARQVGLNDPYDIAFLLRLITGCFALISLYYFLKSQKLNTRVEILFVLLFWFLPFINVRFTSETWSGLLFLNALTVLRGRFTHRYFYTGLLLGLSFLFRYQTALMSLGLVLWLVIIEGIKLRGILALIAGSVIIFFLGIGIDSWFYGSLVVTSYNYLFVNVIQGTASHFGISPWYYFFTQLLKLTIFPTGVLIISSYFLVLRYDPRNIVLWIITPFILVHCLIPHKELRFLFPIANLLPLLILNAIELLKIKTRFSRGINIYIVALFSIYNSFALLYMTFIPADIGNARLTQFIHEKYKYAKVNLFTAHEYTNPYQPWSPLKQSFYVDSNVRISRFQTVQDLDKAKTSGVADLIVIRKSDLYYSNFRNLFIQRDLKLVHSSYPNWLDRLNELIFPSHSNDNLLLFQINKNQD